MSPTFRFIPAMYRAVVVDLIKTQTRRVVAPQPLNNRVGMCNMAYCGHPNEWCVDGAVSEYTCAVPPIKQPQWFPTYGPPGTVRPAVTTWAVHADLDGQEPIKLGWGLLADHSATGKPQDGIWWNDGTPKPAWAGKSRPAMFFPKSLYPLARQARVVSVKAEPVQDISAADAIAEGVRAVQFPDRHPSGGTWLGFHNYQFETAHPDAGTVLTNDQNRTLAFASPVESYRTLWDSINAERGKGALKGQYAWARNPWVFATTFEVLPLAQ